MSNDHAGWCKSRSVWPSACNCHNVEAEIAYAQGLLFALDPKSTEKVVAVRYPAPLAAEVVCESGKVIKTNGLFAVDMRWAGKGKGR